MGVCLTTTFRATKFEILSVFKKIIIEKFARFRFYEYLCTRKIGNLATYGV